jgi:hypothetical protein
MKPDGRKENNGQPKKQEASKKKHIAIYESIGDINELGGMDAVRKILRTAFSEALERKRWSAQPLNRNSAA